MLPMIIVGASTGVMVNKMFPSLIIAVALAILLIFISYKTLRKLLQIIAKERMTYGPACCGKKQEEQRAVEINTAEMIRINDVSSNMSIGSIKPVSDITAQHEEEIKVQVTKSL